MTLDPEQNTQTQAGAAGQTQTDVKQAETRAVDYEQYFKGADDGSTETKSEGGKPPDGKADPAKDVEKTSSTAAQTDKPALTQGVAPSAGGEDDAIARFQKIFLEQQEEIKRLRSGQKAPGAPEEDANARAKTERRAFLEKTYTDYPELKTIHDAMREDILETLGHKIGPLEKHYNKTALENAIAEHNKTVTYVHEDYDAITKSPAFATWIQDSREPEVLRVAREGTAWEVAGLLTLYKKAAGAGVGTGAGTRSAADEKMLAGMVGVKTRSNAVGTTGRPDPNDYQGAFNEAAKLYNSNKGR
jgi:hypothetical protein